MLIKLFARLIVSPRARMIRARCHAAMLRLLMPILRAPLLMLALMICHASCAIRDTMLRKRHATLMLMRCYAVFLRYYDTLPIFADASVVDSHYAMLYAATPRAMP